MTKTLWESFSDFFLIRTTVRNISYVDASIPSHTLMHLKMKHKFHTIILTLLGAEHSDVFCCYSSIVHDLLNYFTTHYWVAADTLRRAALGDGCYPLPHSGGLVLGVRNDLN